MAYGDGEYTYELVEDWAGLPEGETFLDVGSVAIDAEDRVFVLNRSGTPMMVFDRDGERLATWGEEHFSDRPHGMGMAPDGTLWCADDGDHVVMQFTPDGELLTTLGTRGEPSDTGYRHVPDLFERIASITHRGGPFNQPTGAAVNDAGEIYVADGYGNAAVHKFDPEGELLFSWGGPGADEGEFRLPHSIHTDGEGRVWVTDRENSRIQIFDGDGEFLTEWTDVIRPTSLSIVDDETVFVSELCRRVSVFTFDGEPITRWANEGHPDDDPLFVAPHTIAVDSRGDLYVGEVSYTSSGVDRGARTVQKFAKQ